MARKSAPRRKAGGKKPLSPAYSKRIARGEAQGKTRQQARGKKTAEHVERRRREVESGQGTTYERRQTRELADAQAKRNGRPQEEVRAFFDRILRGRGYAAIKRIKASLAALKANRAKRVRRDGKLVTIDFSSIDRARNEMDDLADDYGGDDDWDMFFYH